MKNMCIESAAQAAAFFRAALPKEQKEERVFVLPLDAHGKVLAKPILVSVGSEDGTVTIDAGAIFREAFKAGAEGQDGGAFYTPASVVQYMVEVLQPVPGEKKFLDPACGSGGMFVQAARYMHRHNDGRYVGVVIEDDGMTEAEFATEMAKMHEELRTLGEEARRIEGEILGDGTASAKESAKEGA